MMSSSFAGIELLYDNVYQKGCQINISILKDVAKNMRRRAYTPLFVNFLRLFLHKIEDNHG